MSDSKSPPANAPKNPSVAAPREGAVGVPATPTTPDRATQEADLAAQRQAATETHLTSESPANTPENRPGFAPGHSGNPGPPAPAQRFAGPAPTGEPVPGGVPHPLQAGQPAPIVPATMPNPPSVPDRNGAGVVHHDTPDRKAAPMPSSGNNGNR